MSLPLCIADDICRGDSQLLHTVLKGVGIARADCFSVYYCTVCALVIQTARHILYGICEIIMHKLYLLRVVGE